TLLIAVATLALGGLRDPDGLMLFALALMAYGIFWLGLVVLIDLFVRASTTAARAAGTGWLAIVVLLPAALGAISDLAAPPPSPMSYTNAVRDAALEVRAANAAAARAAADAESGRAYPATLWHSRGEIAVRDARLGPIHESYAAGQSSHRDLAEALRFLSPAVTVQDALDRIAGTDATRALAFQAQARAFAGQVRKLAFEWMDNDRLLTLADYDAGLPRFTFVEPPRGRALAHDLLALIGFAVVVISLAALRLRRGAATLV
ncbi:MAG TPA: DUF3526 domain-containing protein, partial [Sphingomicrobium sp.]